MKGTEEPDRAFGDEGLPGNLFILNRGLSSLAPSARYGGRMLGKHEEERREERRRRVSLSKI